MSTSIDFPNNPNVNDQYTYGDNTYIWNGIMWARINDDITELSGLERRLIALIVGFSVKNALLGNFPLFIIDESLHSADEVSFQNIIEYIGQNVEFLIVTRAERSANSARTFIDQTNIHNKI